MRSPQEGAALAASLYSVVPVINAGDGGHLHPTQTLTDLTTITRRRGGIDGMNIGLCGDLKNGRTVHSLIRALSRFADVSLYLISPRALSIPEYLRTFMQAKGMKYFEITGLEAAIGQLDVLYMTRIQRERFADPAEYERHRGIYVLTASKLKIAKKDLLIMHPLPRVDEITLEVDNDPRAVYFEQARCGMFARMALLYTLIARGRTEPARVPVNRAGRVCVNPACVTVKETYLPPYTRDAEGVRYCSFCDHEVY